MADDKKKTGGLDGLKDVFSDFGKSIKNDAINKGKAWAWGAISDGLDMVSSNAKKSISGFIFKGAPVPRDGVTSNGTVPGRRFRSDNSDPRYTEYSGMSSRDGIGNRSSRGQVALIKTRTEDEMNEIINKIYKKMDATGQCSVASLYQFPEKNIPISISDWSWGWKNGSQPGFGKVMITSGEYVGWYRLVTPDPVEL